MGFIKAGEAHAGRDRVWSLLFLDKQHQMELQALGRVGSQAGQEPVQMGVMGASKAD